MPQLQRGIEALLSKLTPGFRILVDLTELEEMAPECIPAIRLTMATYGERGVSQVARVIPDPLNHIGLNTWESAGCAPAPPGTTGLYHLAILYPTRATLADALRRLQSAEIALDGASDHGVSEALYLRDPDENGVELYWDRPPDMWPRTPEGELSMYTRPLDLEDLLRGKPIG